MSLFSSCGLTIARELTVGEFSILLVASTFACANAEPSPLAPNKPAPPASAADSATQATAPSSGATEALVTKEKRPLSTYLTGAVTASISRMVPDPSGGFTTTAPSTLDERATKAFLSTLDLSQKADGPLVRCPSDTHVEFRDAGGKALGTIGFCGPAARFDAPDGSIGGRRASRP